MAKSGPETSLWCFLMTTDPQTLGYVLEGNNSLEAHIHDPREDPTPKLGMNNERGAHSFNA